MTEVSSVQALLEETPEHPSGEGDLVLLGIPDVNGSIRGKALRPRRRRRRFVTASS